MGADNAGQSKDEYRCGACPLQGSGAGIGRGPRGQNVVHQQNPPSLNCRPVLLGNAKSAPHILAPCNRRGHSSLARGGFDPDKDLARHGLLRCTCEGSRQFGGLIVAALPQT